MATALALAELLDAPWLRLVAVALLIGIFLAREVWTWWGEDKQWAAIYATLLLGFIALAFIVQRIARRGVPPAGGDGGGFRGQGAVRLERRKPLPETGPAAWALETTPWR
jgi:hypothetical protein